MAEFQVHTYKVHLSEGGRRIYKPNPGSPIQTILWKAHIAISNVEQHQFNPELPVMIASAADLYFVENMQAAPQNSRNQANTRFTIFLPIERYEAVLDLLRNEDPVYFEFNESHPEASGLFVDWEDVGEGEIDWSNIGVISEENSAEEEAQDEGILRGFETFEPNATAHTWSNAYSLSLASQHVYGGEGDNSGNAFLNDYIAMYRPWLSQGGHSEVKFDMISDSLITLGGGTQIVVMSNDAFIAVVFRGSQGLDWINNMRFFPIPISWVGYSAGTHRGFLAAVDKHYDELQELLRDHRGSSSKPLWLTGHSLGGALATITALRLQISADYPVQGVLTYGSPPVGAMLFGKAYRDHGLEDRTQRWVNNNDVATRLRGLGHVGIRNFIDGNGAIHLGEEADRINTMPVSFEDHTMRHYSSHLRAALPSPIRDSLPFNLRFRE